MDDGLIHRIERTAGVPGLVGILADRLAPTDLQSLLLEVHRRRVGRTSPATVLEQYDRNRFVTPSALSPATTLALDQLAFGVLGTLGFEPVEFPPVAPLGTVAALTTVDQNTVLATNRNTEVVADSTNTLALESARRRRDLLRRQPRDRTRIRLCTSQRVVRGQRFDGPGMTQHFRLLGLTTAGRDEGSFRFESTSLREQLAAMLRLLDEAGRSGYTLSGVRLSVTDLTDGLRTPVLRESVLDPLAEQFPHVDVGFDDARESGRGYYTDVCFHVHATTTGGQTFQLGDGGFTTWTAQLLGNAKERLLIGGLGTELLCGNFTDDAAATAQS